jgi:nucleotidyltransferase/DNA polymerase involved in DNA repair
MDEEGHTSVVLHADLDCFYAAVLLILLIHLLLDLVAKPLVQLSAAHFRSLALRDRGRLLWPLALCKNSVVR